MKSEVRPTLGGAGAPTEGADGAFAGPFTSFAPTPRTGRNGRAILSIRVGAGNNFGGAILVTDAAHAHPKS